MELVAASRRRDCSAEGQTYTVQVVLRVLNNLFNHSSPDDLGARRSRLPVLCAVPYVSMGLV